MSFKRIALVGLGAIVLVIGGSVVVFLVMMNSQDEVTARYRTMTMMVEDMCTSMTSATDCGAYASCYRDGLEAALPRDVMTEIVQQGRAYVIPASVNEAVRQLERACGERVGLVVQ